jgi:hypothetical protein
MTVQVNTSGSQTATISTEHTLATVATAGVFLLVVDLATLVAGDVVELRVYGKARSSDTERLLHRGTYGPSPLASPLVMSVPLVSPHHLKATLKQTDGTGRAFPWAIYET